MVGRIRQKQLLELQASEELNAVEIVICPICLREIPPEQQEAHHLIPKSKGGRATEYLHKICHRQIHALFTDTQLAAKFNAKIHPLGGDQAECIL
jgi:hypothetical protein